MCTFLAFIELALEKVLKVLHMSIYEYIGVPASERMIHSCTTASDLVDLSDTVPKFMMKIHDDEIQDGYIPSSDGSAQRQHMVGWGVCAQTYGGLGVCMCSKQSLV